MEWARPASGPLHLSDEGENDGGPKNDPDPYKAERCYSLSPARLSQATSQRRSGFVPPLGIRASAKTLLMMVPHESPTAPASNCYVETMALERIPVTFKHSPHDGRSSCILVG
jgi:hypothetical protein